MLSVNEITSWKFSGGSDETVVVLRLKPTGSLTTTTMADPALNHRTQVQYRRKPPSQWKRDTERARRHNNRLRKEKAGECGESIEQDTELLVPDREDTAECGVEQGRKLVGLGLDSERDSVCDE